MEDSTLQELSKTSQLLVRLVELKRLVVAGDAMSVRGDREELVTDKKLCRVAISLRN